MKIIVITIFAITALLVGTILFSGPKGDSNGNGSQTPNNVSVIDGKQIITISAKGGYTPRVTNATAGIPTQIKVNTQGTFDCSSGLVIPSVGYRKSLPPSGTTFVDVPPQEKGSVLQGLCTMGMYNFQVKFN